MKNTAAAAIITLGVLGYGCSSGPSSTTGVPPAVPNENWQLTAEFKGASSKILVATLKNISSKPLKAYERNYIITLFSITEPPLPNGGTLPTLVDPNPFSITVPPGASLTKTEISLSKDALLSAGENGTYIGRLVYDDTGANLLLGEKEKSKVGRVYSEPFGFKLRSGEVYDVWHTDGNYIVMPRPNGAVSWPKGN